jgi:hypothetical protein
MGMHMDGSKHHVLLTGSVKSTHFAEFLEAAPFPAGTVILLDNHSMHKTVLVRSAALAKGYTLLNTPPYSPEFNPIELMFGITKNAFYKARYSKEAFGGDDMAGIVSTCLAAAATPTAVSGCFRHVADIVGGGGRGVSKGA